MKIYDKKDDNWLEMKRDRKREHTVLILNHIYKSHFGVSMDGSLNLTKYGASYVSFTYNPTIPKELEIFSFRIDIQLLSLALRLHGSLKNSSFDR